MALRTVLVGGAGFIGSLLSQELVKSGVQVSCVDFRGLRERCCNEFADELACGLYRFVDASDEKEIDFQLQGADALVLLAAKRLNKQFTSATAVENLSLAESYFYRAKQAGLRNIVFLSSIGVYGCQGGYPWREEMAGKVENLYALSKWQTELLADYYNRRENMAIKSLRPAQVLGLGERPGFVLNTFIEQAWRGEQLHIYGTGSGRRQYIYIYDLVRAIVLALEHPECKGAYNIACAGSLSIVELAEKIQAAFGRSLPLVYEPYPTEDLGHYEMEVSKAKEDLDFIAEFTVPEALADIHRELKSRTDRENGILEKK